MNRFVTCILITVVISCYFSARDTTIRTINSTSTGIELGYTCNEMGDSKAACVEEFTSYMEEKLKWFLIF